MACHSDKEKNVFDVQDCIIRLVGRVHSSSLLALENR